MIRPAIRRNVGATIVAAALWGAAAGVIEAFLLERWLGIALRAPASFLIQAANYAAFTVALAVGALVVLALASRLRPRPAPHRRAAGTLDLARSRVDAIVGPSVLVAVVIGYVSLQPARDRGGAAGDVAAMLAAALGALTLAIAAARSRRARRAIQGALLVVVAIGVLREPIDRLAIADRLRISAVPRDATRPGVILIVIDTLRADALSAYGSPVLTSPRIDALAARGVRFTRVRAQAPWTLPSVATIFTGVHPGRHGVRSVDAVLDARWPTLPRILRDAGYATGGFSENDFISPRRGFGRGFHRFWSPWLPWVQESTCLHRALRRAGLDGAMLAVAPGTPVDPVSPDEVAWDARRSVDRVIDWLARTDGRPFFVYLQLMGPHTPYGPREFLLDGPPPAVPIANHPRDGSWGQGYPLAEPGTVVDPSELALLRTLYAADVRYVDREIGRLVSWLETRGILDRSFLVITSDHGEEFYEHEAWAHGSTFREVIDVPLIMSGPGLPAGTLIDRPARLVDLAPTLLDLLGIDRDLDVDGRSLLGLVDGEDGGPDPVTFIDGSPVRPPGCEMWAIIAGEHKLCRVELGGERATLLYDLAADGRETTDLTGTLPALADSLSRMLDRWRITMETGASPSRALGSDEIRSIRNLGYID